MDVGAIIMLGAGAESTPEHLVLEAQRAATLDLVRLLQPYPACKLILSSPDLSWFPLDVEAELELDSPNVAFHFGSRLADLIEIHRLEQVLYFGGGSAPLLDGQLMDMIAGLILMAGSNRSARVPTHIALTNNRHSSDWVCLSRAGDALPLIRETGRDNSLAWALQESGEYEVRVLSGLRPATSMDLDTPADLALARLHPECPPHLLSALGDPGLDTIPIQETIDVIRRDGSQVTIIGRVAPLAWQALNKVTRCWIRIFAEERGMAASERLVRGEVNSLLGALLEAEGAYKFFEHLANVSDAALIDSRVLMASHYGNLPSRAERFSSDMFMVENIRDPWLQEFTQAAKEAPIPIVLGGHNVVAGGLYAIAEIIGGRFPLAGE